MPNEVEETLRVLNVQISEFKNKLNEYELAYKEFKQEGEELKNFDFICDILYKGLKYYENLYLESVECREEIREKYNL